MIVQAIVLLVILQLCSAAEWDYSKLLQIQRTFLFKLMLT